MAAAANPRLWVDRPDSSTPPSALAAALAIAGALHLIVLLGVGFELPKAPSERPTTRPLEVVVLRQAAPTEHEPETVDAYAQVNREGGGIEQPEEAKPEPVAEPPARPAADVVEPLEAPLPTPPMPEPMETAEPQPTRPAEETTLTASLEPLPSLEEPVETTSPPEPEPEIMPEPARPRVTAAQILASRNLEIAELTARIQEQSTAYSNRMRRKAISASTREYKYANYLEAWRRKVERIGNLNYPEEAKRHKLYGALILHVAVRADGSIERVKVLRSSGFDVLDEAAVRIVELAAPFAPFPPDIKSETDVLDITRTWQFLNTNRLGWDN